MSRETFLSEIKRTFAPSLRSEGFKGSGTTFRRYVGPLIHVVNIQGSVGGQHCYLNLGAHLSFLGPVAGEPPDPAKIKEYECAFRTRINPSSNGSQGWPYGTTQMDAIAEVSDLREAYGTGSARFFGQFASYPESFSSVVPASLQPTNAPHSLGSGSALVWAKIAKHLGRSEVAREFALLGLAEASPRASVYRRECERIASEA